MNRLMIQYRDIPAGSAVMVANVHINYLRPDLRVLYPVHGPCHVNGRVLLYSETLDELSRRSERMSYRQVYLDVQETLVNTGRADVSFRLVAENSQDSFVRIR
jgi:hypothetical protein